MNPWLLWLALRCDALQLTMLLVIISTLPLGLFGAAVIGNFEIDKAPDKIPVFTVTATVITLAITVVLIVFATYIPSTAQALQIIKAIH